MDYTYVNYREVNGSEQNRKIQKVAIKCPFCKVQMIPKYLYSCGNNDIGVGVFANVQILDAKSPLYLSIF